MLRGQAPGCPVLFEHYIEWPILLAALGGDAVPQDDPPWGWCLNIANGFARLGFDCAPLYFPHLVKLQFVPPGHSPAESISQNEPGPIRSRDDVARHPWPDVGALDLATPLDAIAAGIPEGLKLSLYAPRGIFESLVDLLGFDALCLAFHDDPGLIDAVVAEVGTRTAAYLERCLPHEAVGAFFISDDLGYKTSLMVAPDLIRRHVLPWHRRFVEIAHRAGKPAILHSCGQVGAIMEDIIEVCRYDAKHSFEDVICPVETMYARYGNRIAILGGLDVDFLSRSTPDTVARRAAALLELTGCRRYALGSGNSLTAAMPRENVAALLAAVHRQL